MDDFCITMGRNVNVYTNDNDNDNDGKVVLSQW